jgi:hypothetical protein
MDLTRWRRPLDTRWLVAAPPLKLGWPKFHGRTQKGREKQRYRRGWGIWATVLVTCPSIGAVIFFISEYPGVVAGVLGVGLALLYVVLVFVTFAVMGLALEGRLEHEPSK